MTVAYEREDVTMFSAKDGL